MMLEPTETRETIDPVERPLEDATTVREDPELLAPQKPPKASRLSTADFQAVVYQFERDGRPATQIRTAVPVGTVIGRFGNPQIVPSEQNEVVFSDGQRIPVP